MAPFNGAPTLPFSILYASVHGNIFARGDVDLPTAKFAA